MKSQQKISTMVTAALLCAIGIVIPMFCPKIALEPMSFTLGSHIALFIAMFISPSVALFVELGATVGFLLSGLPTVVVLRALSQVFFVFLGALWLKKKPELLTTVTGNILFVAVTGVVHAFFEMVVVSGFYFGGAASGAYYEKGFVYCVLLLVGLGTFVHSAVDYILSYLIWRPIEKVVHIPVNAKF